MIPPKNLINFYKECDLTDYTVLFPSLGVGNVAQLSMDLLISTLHMEKVGTVWHHSIVPIIGPKAFEHDTSKVTTSFAATMVEFFNEMIDFLKSNNIAKLILLTTSYAYEQHFVGSNPFEIIQDDAFKNKEKDVVQRMQWSEFKGDTIHGGGYATHLMSVASRKGVATLILFKYVSEGDNSVDAVSLLEELNAGFNFVDRGGGKIKIIFPMSWKSLFGNPLPEQLY